MGGWEGELSAEGESLTLIGADGMAVRRTFVGELGDPTPVQESLRVTEINYAPLPPNPDFGESDDGTPNAADKFEYIELTNTGTQTLNLTGVTLGAGVEFTFLQGSVLARASRSWWSATKPRLSHATGPACGLQASSPAIWPTRGTAFFWTTSAGCPSRGRHSAIAWRGLASTSRRKGQFAAGNRFSRQL